MKSLKNGQRRSVGIFIGVPLLPNQVLATLYSLAKWKSFLRHVANKHANHPDPLYHKCNHEELPPRKWIKIGELSHFTVFNAAHAGSSVLLFVCLFVCLFFF